MTDPKNNQQGEPHTMPNADADWESYKARQRPRFDVPLPGNMRGLPRDERGYVVPYFVAWFIDGHPVPRAAREATPDFRVIDPTALADCLSNNRCWVCGHELSLNHVYCIGPMCSINRITSEPPMHYTCAEYALKVCPLMLNPNAKRNLDHSDIEGGVVPPSGIHDPGNPGVFITWMQRTKPKFHTIDHGVLLQLDEPVIVEWWARGRKASYAEADLALVHGFTKLENIARTKDGPGGIAELRRLYREARKYLPHGR